MSITASEARQRLFPLIEEVNAGQVAVEIVSKKGTAYLVPADEYRSLKRPSTCSSRRPTPSGCGKVSPK